MTVQTSVKHANMSVGICCRSGGQLQEWPIASGKDDCARQQFFSYGCLTLTCWCKKNTGRKTTDVFGVEGGGRSLFAIVIAVNLQTGEGERERRGRQMTEIETALVFEHRLMALAYT